MTALQDSIAPRTPAHAQDLFARARLGEVTTSIHPFGDSIGYLFTHRGQMYRAIRPQHSGFYRQLFERGVIGRLVERGVLVGSEIVDEQLPGFDLVIRHERLPHTSYPTEWSTSMMRDAALATLDVQLELMQHGATMEDAHPWNVVFSGTQPVLVDLTAITPATDGPRWEGERTFRVEFMRPLELMLRGRTGLAHVIANTGETDNWEIWRLWRHRLAETIARARTKFGLATTTRKRVESWRRQLLDIQPRTSIAQPGRTSSTLVSHARTWNIDSVNVIGAADTTLPLALAETGLRVVACTTDESLAESLYHAARANKRNVLPVILDALAATSTFGTFGRPSRAGAATRLACDAVIVPGNRAVPSTDQQWMHLDQQIEAASMYATGFAAIQFAGTNVAAGPRWAELLERHFEAPEVIVDSDNNSHWLAGRLRRA